MKPNEVRVGRGVKRGIGRKVRARAILSIMGAAWLGGSVDAAVFTDQADVTAVRGVFNPASETRCWVEREQVVSERRRDGSDVNVPAAIIGGIIGGVAGHQIGGGRGRDVATAGGAVAGALVGGNIGCDESGGGDRITERRVERCREMPRSAQPVYWDVDYTYRGLAFSTQLNYEPGPQIPVRVSVDPQ